MFLATADVIDRQKKSYDGSRGWFNNLRVGEKKVSVLDFVNTIIVHRLQHHFPIATGDLTKELMEVGTWLGIKPLEVISYRNYMQNP